MLKKIRLVSLRTRAIILVTLALLPLGAIGVWQTNQILTDQSEAAIRSLIATTENAAARERQIIERAIGGAAALATTTHALKESPDNLCQTVLRRFVNSSTLYNYVAFYDQNGRFQCGSAPRSESLEASPALLAVKDQRIIGIYRGESFLSENGSALKIATPVFQDAEYSGHLELHITEGAFRPDSESLAGARPDGLITFNASGDVLTSEVNGEMTDAMLPAGRTLASLGKSEAYSFNGPGIDGATYKYTVLPIVPGLAYAMGTWPGDTVTDGLRSTSLRAFFLALLVWAGSVVTVYLLMHFLVIRGLHRLHHQMSSFATTRAVPDDSIEGRGEIFEMEQNFRELATTILLEEAELENSVREKNVLLKEVHHRVKNNLQLINSIINMVLRGKPSTETRLIVRRLQDRVMALASVHRLIYQSQSMDRVDAAPLVSEVVNQSIALGMPKGVHTDLSMQLDRVTLYPDQALPLTLLVSEAITNAIKYTGTERPKITVTLGATAAQQQDARPNCTLQITNTVAVDSSGIESTSIGSKLMRAFAMQLGGSIDVTEAEGTYTMTLHFPVEAFSPVYEDTQLDGVETT